MPYVIPDTMPQDWLVPALESIDVPFNDDRVEAIEAAMKKTYDDLLASSRIPTINARLRVACLASAQLHKDG